MARYRVEVRECPHRVGVGYRSGCASDCDLVVLCPVLTCKKQNKTAGGARRRKEAEEKPEKAEEAAEKDEKTTDIETIDP